MVFKDSHQHTTLVHALRLWWSTLTHCVCRTDVPTKPGTPEIVDWDEKSVSLKWERPKSDNGAPITGYIIEKKERFGSSWEPCAETKVGQGRTRMEKI